MSRTFTVCVGFGDCVRSYFTTDRRTARRLARRSGVTFRVDREGPSRSYAGGQTLAQIVAEDVLSERHGDEHFTT